MTTGSPTSPTRPVGVLLVGGHGHGKAHLRSIQRLQARDVVRLAGVCDTRPPAGEAAELSAGAAWFENFDAAMGAAQPEIVIVSTPIHTHADLAERAMRGGADVLLEKPPTATLAGYQRLAEVVTQTGRACQVGFQTLGFTGIDAVRDLIEAGALGQIRGIGVFGAWIRDASYWTRSPWAGHRTLDGRPVCDGAVTNPFAHPIATALRIDGSEHVGDLAEVSTELFRASPIEADDTSCVRMKTRRGTTIAVGVTLCAATESAPYVVVHGEHGSATFWYGINRVRVTTRHETTETDHTAIDVLEDLAAHVRDRSRPLVVPLARTGAFMQVLEAVRVAPEPAEIGAEYQRIEGTGPERRHIVEGVEACLERVATDLVTFTEAGAPWATSVSATRGGTHA